MTTSMLVIAALATFAIHAVTASQQPWQLPSLPLQSPLAPPSHLTHSKGVRLYSLCTAETHQQVFPLRPTTAQGPAAGHPSATPQAPSLRWTLSNTNESIQIDALFPSLAHLDLLRAGIIAEPSIGLNEGLYRWIIDESTWTYTADLTPILNQLESTESQEQWLYFQGLDTIADVYIAGELINSTHNAHLWHAFPIPSQLLSEEREERNITLVFHNTNEYAAEQAKRFDPGYPTQIESRDRSRTTDYEYPNRIYVRKQQSDFGWDWGPALIPVGPYKPAYLIALPTSTRGEKDKIEARPRAEEPKESQVATRSRGVVVLSSGIDIYRKGQINNLPPPDPEANWIVNVTLTLLSAQDVQWPSIRLEIPCLDLYTFDTYLSSQLSAGLDSGVHAVFEIPYGGKHSPSLWWPRGHGEQQLYNYSLRSDELGLDFDRTVGFRTAEIYVMGTNLIPFDTLSPRTSPAYLRWLLESAVQSNVNMIRVWGGGSYATQEFLDVCDRMGIMVWMDAMFAASLYPYNEEVLEEGRYDQYDRKRELHGTGEHYGYNASLAFDIDSYPRSRFMVEFGMFSLPSIHTLDRIIPLSASSDQETELYSVNSTILRAHLKYWPAGNPTYPFPADQGQTELVSAITTYFPTPSSTIHAPRALLNRYCYSSQLYQSLYVTNQIAMYRHGAARSERNRGLVVWQLNDVWEGTTWSSLEYAGRWKMVHYNLAKVQRELAVVAVHDVKKDDLEIDLLYTNAAGVRGEATVTNEWFDFRGKRLREEEVHKVRVPDGEIGYKVVQKIENLSTTICSNKREGCWLRLTLTSSSRPRVNTYWTAPEELARTLTHLFADEQLGANLTLSRVRSSNKAEHPSWQVKIKNTGAAVAPYVWLEHGPNHVGYFARNRVPENGIILRPGEEGLLTFVRANASRVPDGGEERDEEDWFNSLSVSSLFDNFGPLSAKF
ncbi:related to Beta-mannosidase precursor [Ustilago sp. UG-2017a]|nr:related to Beta-mannosidase precursor [Ustilago sp. UG-2017a]